MQHPQGDHPGADDLEDGPVITVQQMAIGGAERFVFRYKRAAFGKTFRCADLLLQAPDKGRCLPNYIKNQGLLQELWHGLRHERVAEKGSGIRP